MTESTEWKLDRSRLKDAMGRPLTQSLFLEYQYNDELAVYSLSDEDKVYNDKFFPSLRKRYLHSMDPTEYTFALDHFLSWDQWQRICENQAMATRIAKWREELEVKIRSRAVRNLIALNENFSAQKWAADGHWNVKRGRPTKEEQQRERKIRSRAVEEAAEDGNRIAYLVRKPNG